MTTAADVQRRLATLDVIVAASTKDLDGLFRPLLSDPVERAAAGLREALPAVAESYGGLAGDQAAIWYEDMRTVPSRWQPQPFTPPSLAEARGLTTWAVTPLFKEDSDAAWTRLSGLLQKTVTDFDRVTVERNVERDPVSRGWRRQARADACAYCAYMAVVLDQPDYHTAAKSYHDDCRCVPVPDLGQGFPEQPNHDLWAGVFDDAYNAINREQTRLRRAYRRAGGRSSSFFREHPHLSLTTENILARARRLAPDAFKDGVRLAA